MRHLFILGALLCPMLCAAAPIEATQQEIDRREKDGDHILQEESHQYQTAVHASTPNEIFQLKNDERFKQLLELFEVEEIKSLPGLFDKDESGRQGDEESVFVKTIKDPGVAQGSQSRLTGGSEHPTNEEQHKPSVLKEKPKEVPVSIKVIELDDGDSDDIVQKVLTSQQHDSQIDSHKFSKLGEVDTDLVKLIKNSLSQNVESKEKLENSEVMIVKKTPSLMRVLAAMTSKFVDAEGVYLADQTGAEKDVHIKVLYLGDPETDAFIESVLKMDNVESLLQKHKFTVLKENPESDLQLETLNQEQLKKLVEESPETVEIVTKGTALKPTKEQPQDVKTDRPTIQIQNPNIINLAPDILGEVANEPQTTEANDKPAADLDASLNNELKDSTETTTNVSETGDEEITEFTGAIDVRLGGLRRDSIANRNPSDQQYQSVQIPTLRSLRALGSSESDGKSSKENKGRPSKAASTLKDTTDGVQVRVLATTNMKDIAKLTKRVSSLEEILGELLYNHTLREKHTTTYDSLLKEEKSNGDLDVKKIEDVKTEDSSDKLLINEESPSSSESSQDKLSNDPQINTEFTKKETVNSSSSQKELLSSGKSDGELIDTKDVLIEDISEKSLINHETTQSSPEEPSPDLQAPLLNSGHSEVEIPEESQINREGAQGSQKSQEELSHVLQAPVLNSGPSEAEVPEGSEINHESAQGSQQSQEDVSHDPQTNAGHSEEETLITSPSQNEFTSIHLSNGETLALFYAIDQAAETSDEESARTKRSASDDVLVYLKPERAHCKETVEETNNKEDQGILSPPELGYEPKTKKYIKKIELDTGKRVGINSSRRRRAIHGAHQRDHLSYFDNRLEGPGDRRPAWTGLRYYSHPDEALRFEYQPIVRQTRDYEPLAFDPAYFRANRGYGFNEWGGLGLNP